MGRDEARSRDASARTAVHWREWEKRVERLLKANSSRWAWFHLPRMRTKQENQRLPKDLPDYWCVGKTGSDREGRIHVIECKTGAARQTVGQRFLLRCLLAVPGVSGGVYYPHQYAKLVEEIGEDVVG